MNRFVIGLVALTGMGCCHSQAQTHHHTVDRIESMPSVPPGYMMRDWKEVTRRYVELTLNSGEGDYMPLSRQSGSGINYPAYEPLFMDTYVGGNAHGNVSECINVLPAVVSAFLTGNETRSSYRLVEGVMDFFNAANGQNVYLNNFSARSGKDWWYDLMPNVYFYQLCSIAEMPDDALASWQYRSVADQWLKAVMALGGDTYEWRVPDMRYRAFDLIEMKPLTTGVVEPESAGSIAWILFHAYLETGNEDYRKGAELAMEYLNSLGSNPAYELQLAYGVQAAAKMNALLGTAYRTTKMFGNCFDRGYLRGWGSIVGNWGGYEMSGLIGEANDKGNDYAFVMNGFQQAAALAPAVKYDKRLARAYARWMVNVASASRFFYAGFLPDGNMDPVSLAWSKAHDSHSVIPYEAIKQKWNGVSPYAMGDAIGGKWAATNLSLYSGSSVGYLAAVVETTDVEAILQLDLNATDFDGRDKYATYLYYNPYTESRTVSVPLPAGSFRIYDAVTETVLSESASGIYGLDIPADDIRLVTLIPAGVDTRVADGRLYAGDVVVDYHYGYDFEERLRIKNLEAADPYPVKGDMLMVKATLGGDARNASFRWSVDGTVAEGQTSGVLELSTSSMSAGKHKVVLEVNPGAGALRGEVDVEVLSAPVSAPEITQLEVDAAMPAAPASTVTAECRLKDAAQPTDVAWSVNGGDVAVAADGRRATWKLPAREGVYSVTCTAKTVKGEDTRTAFVLVRGEVSSMSELIMDCPFNGDVSDLIAGYPLVSGGGAMAYAAGHSGDVNGALSLNGGWLYHSGSEGLLTENAVTVAFWAAPEKWPGGEQFIVSHGSWQDRYKVSVTPERHIRWTVKTTGNVVDVDCPEPMALGRYEHVCAVYTGFSAELYHNGRLAAFAPLDGKLGSTAHPLTVGSMNESDLSYNFHGRIDELKLYNGALAPHEIAELYSKGTVGVEQAVGDAHGNISFRLDGGSLMCTLPEVRVLGIYAASGIRIGYSPVPATETALRGATSEFVPVAYLGKTPAGIYLIDYADGVARGCARLVVR